MEYVADVIADPLQSIEDKNRFDRCVRTPRQPASGHAAAIAGQQRNRNRQRQVQRKPSVFKCLIDQLLHHHTRFSSTPKGSAPVARKNMSCLRWTQKYLPPAPSHFISPSEPGGGGFALPGSVARRNRVQSQIHRRENRNSPANACPGRPGRTSSGRTLGAEIGLAVHSPPLSSIWGAGKVLPGWRPCRRRRIPIT